MQSEFSQKQKQQFGLFTNNKPSFVMLSFFIYDQYYGLKYFISPNEEIDEWNGFRKIPKFFLDQIEKNKTYYINVNKNLEDFLKAKTDYVQPEFPIIITNYYFISIY